MRSEVGIGDKAIRGRSYRKNIGQAYYGRPGVPEILCGLRTMEEIYLAVFREHRLLYLINHSNPHELVTHHVTKSIHAKLCSVFFAMVT